MDWPFVQGARLVAVAATGSSTGTDLVDAQNSKPATPTQIIASTANDACGIVVTMTNMPTATSCLVDIMIGGAGAEYVLLPDLMFTVATGAECGDSYFFPIFVPKGSRLSGRVSSTAASGSYIAHVHLLEGAPGFGFAPFSKVTAYGVTAASSRGTNIDPGASANTKPALPATQLVASTADPIYLMTVAIGQAGDFARTPAAQAWCDIDVGAGSSEFPVIQNIGISFGTSKDAWRPGIPVQNVPVWVPPGSRLSSHGQCSVTTAGDRLWDVVVYGVS